MCVNIARRPGAEKLVKDSLSQMTWYPRTFVLHGHPDRVFARSVSDYADRGPLWRIFGGVFNKCVDNLANGPLVDSDDGQLTFNLQFHQVMSRYILCACQCGGDDVVD